MEFILEAHYWIACGMLIIFTYSSIMWFWLSEDKQKIGNASFRLLITLEMIVSGLLLILGLGVIISNPSWFSVSGVYIKIFLGLITIGAIHMCAAKTKKFIQSSMDIKNIKGINIIRIITIFLLMTVFTMGMMINAVEQGQIKELEEKVFKGDN
tara:strand:+ start:694 stop:1155 length:462 start_codon:yes stop_codon:yes gene_type:complete